MRRSKVKKWSMNIVDVFFAVLLFFVVLVFVLLYVWCVFDSFVGLYGWIWDCPSRVLV